MASEIAGQGVQFPAGRVHIIRTGGGIESGQQDAQLGGVHRLNIGFQTRVEKLPQTFVQETLDHGKLYLLTIQNATLHRLAGAARHKSNTGFNPN